jgi:hypothetical protein
MKLIILSLLVPSEAPVISSQPISNVHETEDDTNDNGQNEDNVENNLTRTDLEDNTNNAAHKENDLDNNIPTMDDQTERTFDKSGQIENDPHTGDEADDIGYNDHTENSIDNEDETDTESNNNSHIKKAVSTHGPLARTSTQREICNSDRDLEQVTFPEDDSDDEIDGLDTEELCEDDPSVKLSSWKSNC